ncbi:uncharacterized protein DDB_G0271670-like isoform X1 [Pectinophora gossypiella]|uniref:uncharacterized protein DDB_G0271670-like isoform X1 n=1 Tax=Pectinophora gossypiella TaxID=13191 RepID=UPI00214E03BC|nr:uncharacterized protein DDB_G0271670-like isoform X1 [Pectinophora gossypiella]
MRKTSQDGGDSTSISSGLENDILKRPGGLLMKTKKTSIKRKVQNLSESDEGVVEPLLQRDKERTESVNQSAKFLMSKSKTESTSEKGDDKDKLLADNQALTTSMTSVPGITDNQTLANGIKDMQINKSCASSAPIHNHMNTNVFSTHDGAKTVGAPKTQILVEIDGNKTYNPSPLIFTTAKIHTDGKTKPMEPVQVTPVPILSTIEGSVVKSGTTTDKLKFTSGTTIKDDVLSNLSKTISAKDQLNVSSCSGNNATSYSGASGKDTISTISENKKPNTSIKTTTVSTTISNVTDKIPKVTSSVDYVKSITQLKTAVSSPISLPQTEYFTISEIARTTAIDRNCKSVPGTSNTVSHANISKIANINDKLETKSQSKIDTAVIREVEVDVNKNVQTVSNSDFEKSETSKEIKSTVNTKDEENLPNKSKINRITSSSISNKQLQRQKSTVEDAKDSDTGVKQNVTKKDSSDITNNKITGNEKTVVCSPKSNASSSIPVSKMSTAGKTTVQSTIPTKSTISTSKVPSTLNKLTGVDGKTTLVAPKTSTTPSIKETPNVTITGSLSKPSTTKITTAASTNLVKTLSTGGTKSVPSTTTSSSQKNTSSSIPKSTAATGQSTTSSTKPLIVSTVKSTPTAATTKPSTSSALSKTSTVTTMKASVTKAPSATKVTHSKSATSTAATAKTAPSNQDDPKTNDKSKDDKSKA